MRSSTDGTVEEILAQDQAQASGPAQPCHQRPGPAWQWEREIGVVAVANCPVANVDQGNIVC